MLALGNRPKGERFTYALTLWVYAILSLYLIVCSFWLTIRAFEVCTVYYHSMFLRNKVLSMQHLSFAHEPTVFDRIKTILTGPANVLLAALVSTFGMLNVYDEKLNFFDKTYRHLLHGVVLIRKHLCLISPRQFRTNASNSETRGICLLASHNICF